MKDVEEIEIHRDNLKIKPRISFVELNGECRSRNEVLGRR